MLATATQPVTVRSATRADVPVLLRGECLSKSFGGQTVLDGIDLELRPGEVVLLRGENGSGKTTLLNILTGNLEPDAGAIHYLADGSPRSYRFPRRWWQDLNPLDHFTPEFVVQEGMGRTWQDIRLFGAQTLRDNIAVAEPGHLGENPVLALLSPGRCAHQEMEINKKADAMLARFGLAGREGSSADMISLGQSKRIAIARAVATGARILFLDEPLAGLDRRGIQDVISLLESLVRERNITLVIVEHVFNQPHLHGLITTDWLLEKGKLNRNGRASPTTVHRPLTTNATRPAWFEFLAGDGADVVDEPLPKGAVLTRIRLRNRFQPKPLLSVDDFLVKRGYRTVIGMDDEGADAGFSLKLHPGEIAILQAPNGWGKSTLFEALAGLIPVARGNVRLGDTTLSSLPDWQRPRHGLHLNAAGAPYFKGLRLSDVAKLSGHQLGGDDAVPGTRVLSSLSGGQLRRASLAAFLHRPNLRVALLDEPFLALDEAAAREFANRVRNSSAEATLIAEPHFS